MTMTITEWSNNNGDGDGNGDDDNDDDNNDDGDGDGDCDDDGDNNNNDDGDDNNDYGSERCGIFDGISHIIPSHTIPRYGIQGGHTRPPRKIWSEKLLVSLEWCGKFLVYAGVSHYADHFPY